MSSDIANTFTTLSTRGLNPSLKIIARAEDESSKGDNLIVIGEREKLDKLQGKANEE